MATASGRNVIAAVDDSQASEAACQWAAENFIRPDDTVYLVHVLVLPPSYVRAGIDMAVVFPDETINPTIKQEIQHAKGFITAKFVPKVGGVSHEIEVIYYNVGAEKVGQVLCKRAAALDAAAVILASHDKGAMSRFFLGSTSDYCSKNCPVPVVITR